MNAAPFTAVDVAVLVLLLYSLLIGLVRGFTGELARAVAFFGLLAAVYFAHTPAGRWLEDQTRLGPEYAAIAALALLAVGALLAYLAGRSLLKGWTKLRFHGPIERIGGALAGLVRGAVISAALLIAVGLLPIERIHRAVTEESRFGRTAHRLFPDLVEQAAERLDRARGTPEWGWDEPGPDLGPDVERPRARHDDEENP